ncbi:PREDICTED: bromodomain and PHD finger-containing protein 3-like [Amphimedon queenslandica]|uniref:Peregrin n=1 Tax=Amphimedon queenslandica TaxID=400682 RepID=A0AAN0JDE8_AMPQE|nr:PREDICTED: bromodomain and PHD finger-containing protein 3-like [Amphimedon queenslandica]|eukprot:XP_019854738.1 PREDICTED: bromodomain and PHD finger-containing protein 3-like [Amphimedon queenslandica]
MSEVPVLDSKVLAQQFKDHSVPLVCPYCKKEYKSLPGILYHIGQFRGVTKRPRCMVGGDTPTRGGTPPVRTPSSPMSSRKKTPKREALTWAESQRFVEFELDYEYHRVEIDSHVSLAKDSASFPAYFGDNDSKNDGKSQSDAVSSSTSHTPKRRSKGANATPSNKSSSKSASKRRSKLKNTPHGETPANQAVQIPEAIFTHVDAAEVQDAPPRDSVYYRFIEQSSEELDEMVEYDMDEEDYQWLSLINEERKSEGLTSVPQEAFELLMDRLEKECVFESHVTGNGTESTNPYNIDENAVCCICNDGECHNTNAILFCDMCNLAVHQECYGVPYIPEGQWLCRRCLQSPSRSVDCVLCPNKGGAFKQTIDGRWSHVICGLWIPEIQFANPVFLEPIDGINDVPSARWKLLCYICRKRTGACIQCAKANCYVAFHVTCAQQANLCMKIEMGKNGDICKSAFCDSHTPLSARKKLMESIKNIESAEESEREESVQTPLTGGSENTGTDGGGGGGEELCKKGKSESKVVKRARKILEQQRVTQAPVVNIPYIPQHRLDRIITRVSLHKKAQFIPKLVSYWKLKRQSRNGVPFLRRLQASNKGQKTTVAINLSEEEREALTEQLSLWKTLRHDLERARMLVELVRKREKLKREQLRMSEEAFRLRLTPLEMIMKRLLTRLAAKDPADIFAEPVPLDDVPDYLDVIKCPMDFSTMRSKLDSHQYKSLEEFESDLKLVWNNAMTYNQKDTIYYRAAVRIRDVAKRILDQAYGQIKSAGINKSTGLHDPDVEEPPPLTPNTVAAVRAMDMFGKDGEYGDNNDETCCRLDFTRERHNSTTLDEQVEYLEEQLSVMESQGKRPRKTTKEKQLRKELNSLKRQIKLRDKANDPDATSPPRRRPAPSAPATQDAEGLASQLLHGSLRLTDSRRAILSSSGIKFDERVKTKLEREEREEEERLVAEEEEREEAEEEGSSLDDLTVPVSSPRNTRKRKDSSGRGGSDSDNPISKRRRKSSGKQQLFPPQSSSSSKSLNGLTNGIQRMPEPLELVWAKCRGYPSYPALVIDPEMPSEGLRVNGEFIQAPSDDVLEHKDKNPQNTILVRFFDGRRSWQWLHPTKLDSLGINKDFDHSQLGASGASKRSVQQAYERAMRYHRKVIQSSHLIDDESDCSSST